MECIGNLDPMYIDNRSSHPVKLKHVGRLRPLFNEHNAVYIPDISLELSAGFQTIRTTARQATGRRRVAYQAVATALRPDIVNLLRDTLVSLGQSHHWGFGEIENTRQPPVPEHLAAFMQIDSVIAGEERRGEPSSQTITLALNGPRHIGKSHVLLQLGALLASEPKVVVAFISDCGNLLLDGTEHDRSRYVRLIEYFACVMCMHSKAEELVNNWYGSTQMSTAADQLRTETDSFFIGLHGVCMENNLTLVVILDGYEKIATARAEDTILTLSDLTHRYGAHAVVSADPIHVEAHGLPCTHQCTIAAPLVQEEARNVYAATLGHLQIDNEDLALIFSAAEMHPLDIVRTLARYENLCAISTNADHSAAVRTAIHEQQAERSARTAQMHAHFVREKLTATARAMTPSERNKIVGSHGVIVTQESKGLAPIMDGIRQAAFTVYHHIAPKPGALVDPQFIATIAGKWQRCIPPAARDAIYSAHFNGAVQNQFKWVYESASNKFQIDPLIRLRYFDHALLDTGQWTGTVINPLAANMAWHESVFFAAAKLPALSRDSRLCSSFDDAIELAFNFINTNRTLPPIFVPRTEPDKAMHSITILPLPRVSINEPWIPSKIQDAPGFPGTFMLAITRTDIFSDSKYVRCEYEVTWLANDPLCIASQATVSSSSSTTHRAQSGSAAKAADMADPFALAPVDAIDYDREYGSIQSWSAKAIRLFPDILRRCSRLTDLAYVSKVRLLALAPTARINKLVQNRDDLLAECGMDSNDPLAQSKDVGILCIDEMSALATRNITHYV
ncbi:hypothetical protein EV178_006299 [Coemansia sp. RSA 1646]|nr:hypothetical protein EV178_006299 [Coemansia sp. RSA 1646]